MTALVIIDIQNDFLPGGALAVENGDAVIPIINAVLKKPFTTCVATKDWHPADHGSFAATHEGKKPGDHHILAGMDQILWPVHCVQETLGAEFSCDLRTDCFDKVILKGTDPNVDSYSTFYDNRHGMTTGLGEYLTQKGVKDVYIAGLATDYCVKYSVLDALNLGFNVFVIKDACRAVNLKKGDGERALVEMEVSGAKIVTSAEL